MDCMALRIQRDLLRAIRATNHLVVAASHFRPRNHFGLRGEGNYNG